VEGETSCIAAFLNELYDESQRLSKDQMPQPEGWHESAGDEVKLGVVVKPLVPNRDGTFSACLLPQPGQQSSVWSVLLRMSFSNFSPHSWQRYS
jgi:hypothetical protein